MRVLYVYTFMNVWTSKGDRFPSRKALEYPISGGSLWPHRVTLKDEKLTDKLSRFFFNI